MHTQLARMLSDAFGDRLIDRRSKSCQLSVHLVERTALRLRTHGCSAVSIYTPAEVIGKMKRLAWRYLAAFWICRISLDLPFLIGLIGPHCKW